MATKSAGKRRGTSAAPTSSPGRISDWLSLIKPHLEHYRKLAWGQQSEFIDKLSKSSGYNPNTLRRYIAAAELLESYGITAFPPDLKRLPVAAVEVISRISKRDPARGRDLLNELISGRGKIIDLKDELADYPKASGAKPAKLDRAAYERGLLFGRIGDIDRLLRVAGVARPNIRDAVPFVDWPGPKEIFSTNTWPVLIYKLSHERYAAVLDERIPTWASSPATVAREFMRAVAVAATMFEAVVVFSDFLQADLARVTESMRPDVRRRIVVRPTPHVDPPRLKRVKAD